MIIELYEKRFQRMKALEVKISSLGENIDNENLVQFFEK